MSAASERARTPRARLGDFARTLLLGIGALLLMCGSPAAAAPVTLRVLEWEGYISLFKADFEAWAKEKGKDITLQINPKFISSSDDIFESLRLDHSDIVTPTHNYYQSENAKLAKLLLPLDVAKIESWNDLFPVLRDVSALKLGGLPVGLPLLGGSYALAYDSAKGPEPKSWSILLEPGSKGMFTVTNDQFEANLYQAAIMAGVPPANVFDLDKFTPDQTAKTQIILNQLVANAKGFWGGVPDKDEMRDLRYVTDYWFGVAFANKAGQKWRIAETTEPVTVWMDTIAVSKTVANDPAKLEAAYLLLSYATGKVAQEAIHKAFGSVIVNSKAQAALAGASPGPEFFKEEFFWQPLNPRTRNGFRRMWEEALAAAGRKAK